MMRTLPPILARPWRSWVTSRKQLRLTSGRSISIPITRRHAQIWNGHALVWRSREAASPKTKPKKRSPLQCGTGAGVVCTGDLGLKLEAEAELQPAHLRAWGEASDLSRVVGGNVVARVTKVGVVPGIERFSPDIDFHAFGDLEVFTQREILLDLLRAEHTVKGVIAELVIGRVFKRLPITDTTDVPLVAIVLGARVWITGTLDRSAAGAGIRPQS